jgi:hypothetical protein
VPQHVVNLPPGRLAGNEMPANVPIFGSRGHWNLKPRAQEQLARQWPVDIVEPSWNYGGTIVDLSWIYHGPIHELAMRSRSAVVLIRQCIGIHADLMPFGIDFVRLAPSQRPCTVDGRRRVKLGYPEQGGGWELADQGMGGGAMAGETAEAGAVGATMVWTGQSAGRTGTLPAMACILRGAGPE